MKKLLVLLVVGILIVSSLASCKADTDGDVTKADNEATSDTDNEATSDSESDTTVDESSEKITLTVWHIATDERRHEAVKNAVKRFEAENPNIDVVETAFENDPYKTKLATVMAGGGEPDIFISWGGGWLETFINEGKVLDIDEKIDTVADEYYESALSLYEIKGKNYGLPYSVGPSPVYYNKAIYADLGLEVPTTFKQLEANCDVLLENGYIPFALGNASQWPGALTFITLSLRLGGEETFMNAYNRENGVTFEDESFVKAGEIIQEWVKKGYYPEGMNAINYDTGGSRMLFYNGLAAQMIQTNGLVANAKSEDPDFQENNLGLFVFPTIEGGKGTTQEILGGGNAYSISSSTQNPDEAFELIHALTDQAFGQDSVDLASSVSGAKGVTITDPLINQVQDLLVNATYIQNYYDQFLPPELGTLHKQTTYDLFGLTTTPEQAASEVEAKAVELLGASK